MSLNQVPFFAVLCCWFVFAIAFILRKRHKKTAERKRDRQAMIGAGLEGAGYALVWFFRRPSPSLFPSMTPLLDIIVGTVAILLAISSVWLVITAIKTLDKQWAIAARLLDDHQLITNGPYNRVRNPIYCGMLGMLIATGLVISSWYALLSAFLIFLIGTIIRVNIEERLLHAQFGKMFEDYRGRVPAFIPRIF